MFRDLYSLANGVPFFLLPLSFGSAAYGGLLVAEFRFSSLRLFGRLRRALVAEFRFSSLCVRSAAYGGL